MPGPEAKTPHRKPGLRHDMTKTLYLQPQDLAPKNKVVFLKPALPDKIRTPRLAHCPPEPTGDRDEMDGDDGKKYTTTYTFRGGKLPNTPGFWMDLMLYNAAMKSYDYKFRLTCLNMQQQREANDVPRRPKKVHWDYVLEEARTVRDDLREGRGWNMLHAVHAAEWCVAARMRRVRRKGDFVEAVGGLGYRRQGLRGNEGHEGVVEWGGDGDGDGEGLQTGFLRDEQRNAEDLQAATGCELDHEMAVRAKVEEKSLHSEFLR